MQKKTIKSLLSDSVVYGLSGAISKFLGFLLIPIYTKVLSPADYGLLAISTRFYSILLIIAVLGLDSAVYRFFFDTEDKERRGTVLGNWAVVQIVTTTLLCLFLNFFDEQISSYVIRSGNTTIDKQIIWLICGSLAFNILPAIVNAYFRLNRMAWHAMTFALVSSLLTISFSIYFVLFEKKGIIGILSAQCISLCLASLVAFFILRLKFSINQIDINGSKSLVTYGISIVPSSLSTVGMHFFISLILQYELSKTALGLFHTGSSFASVLTLLTTSFSAAWSPFIFSMIKEKNFEETLSQAHTLYLYCMGFISFLVFTFSKEVLQLLTAPSYYAASWVLGIQTYATFVGSLSVFYILGMSIEKKMKFYPLSTIISSILTIVVGFLFVHLLGIEGVSLAMLLGQLVLVSMILYFSQKVYPLTFNFRGALFIVILMAGVGVMLRLLESEDLKFNLLYKSIVSIVLFFTIVFFGKRNIHIGYMFGNRRNQAH